MDEAARSILHATAPETGETGERTRRCRASSSAGLRTRLAASLAISLGLWGLFAAAAPPPRILSSALLQSSPTRLRLDSEGRFLAAGYATDGTDPRPTRGTLVWDLPSGKIHRVLPGGLADLSHDGSLLVTATGFRDGKGWVRLWSTRSGELLRELEAPGIENLVLGPSGALLAAGCAGGEVRVWETASGTLTAVLHTRRKGSPRVAFGPDATFVVAVSGSEARIWDLPDGELRHTFEADAAFFDAVVVSPDGRFGVLTGNPGSRETASPAFWDFRTGEVWDLTDAPAGRVLAVAVTPDSRTVITAGRDGKIRIRPLRATGVRALEGHEGPVRFLAVSPDGHRLLSAAEDRTVRLWDLGDGRELLRYPGGRPTPPVFFSDDGKRILISAFSGVRVYEAESGAQIRHLQIRGEWIADLQVARDSRFLLTAKQDWTHVWDLTGARRPASIPYGRMNPEGSWVASRDGTTVRIRDLERGALGGTLQHGQAVSVAAPAAEDLLLTGTTGGAVALWDVAAGRLLGSFTGPPSPASSLLLDPADRVIAGFEDGSVLIWSLASGEILQNLPPRVKQPVTHLLLGRGGSCLVVGVENDDRLRVWDPESGEHRFDIDLSTRLYKGFPGPLAITPDGNSLIAVLYGHWQPNLWDLETGRRRVSFTAHHTRLVGLALDADGRRLITVAHDGSVRSWDAATGEPLRILHRFEVPLQSFTLAGAAGFAAVGTADGSIRLLDLESGGEVLRLYSLAEDQWAVVAPDGRWDAARGGDIPEPTVWDGDRPGRLSDHPELFTPGLLGRVMAGRVEPAPGDRPKAVGSETPGSGG